MICTRCIRGRLESISIHGGQVFHIEDQLKRYIPCTFTPDLLEQLKHGLLGERVLVSGNTKYTADNKPISIRVDHIERLRSRSELPAFDVLGKDCGITTVRAHVAGMEGRRLTYKRLISNG